jgi:exonuclease III
MEICIVGDVNISQMVRDSVPRLRMAEPHVLARWEFNDHFLPKTRLIDAWGGKHGEDARAYTWFLCGVKEGTYCTLVDMILVTAGLYACATGMEIEKWGGMASKSDHAIMWIEIDGLPQKNT